MQGPYAIVCVQCECFAYLRTGEDIGRLLSWTKGQVRTANNKHLVNSQAFEVLHKDSLLLTLCWSCERERSTYYNLSLLTQTASADNSRHANHRLATTLINSWPIIRQLRNATLDVGFARDYATPRPILKVEFVSRLVGHPNVEVKGVYHFNGENLDQFERQRFFTPGT